MLVPCPVTLAPMLKELLSMTLMFALPTEWFLNISADQRDAAWQSSQIPNYHRRGAYLSALCLETVLPWFQSEYNPLAQAWLPTREQQGLWGWVMGSVVLLGSKRLLLLPTESSDTEALDIPQEWIDIPTWAVDYILAVQVDPEGEWLNIWGYTTQAQVKAQGDYDMSDRTYAIAAPDMEQDLNALSEILSHCPDAVTQHKIADLPCLEERQAENLIQRLSNPELTFPRQAVPFQQWAALLNSPAWRRRLVEAASPEDSIPVATRLSDWFQSAMGEGWQSVEMLLGKSSASLVSQFRNAEVLDGSLARRAKPVQLTARHQSQTVVLLMQLNPEPDDRVGVVIQLHPSPALAHMPAGIELCLCSPLGNVLQTVRAESQDDYIQLTRFRCPVETQFQVQIQLGELVVVESFIA